MLTEPAPAKINLALHVRARRPDGYHEIETLFAFCRDGDVVTIAEANENSFTVTGPFAPALAGEGNNLVLAARDAFAAAFGPLPPLAIALDKHLPVASGIGGGSADAAAVLRALGQMRGVAVEDMAAIAISLGSDVPACLLGSSAVGGGRGEELLPIEGLTNIPVLLVNPSVAVTSGRVFRGWDGVDRGPISGRHPGLVPGSNPAQASPLAAPWMPDQVRHDGWVGIAVENRNDLEAPARALVPMIGDLLDLLAAQPGVTLARMSGSGATCYALFETDTARHAAATAITAAHASWWTLETSLA